MNVCMRFGIVALCGIIATSVPLIVLGSNDLDTLPEGQASEVATSVYQSDLHTTWLSTDQFTDAQKKYQRDSTVSVTSYAIELEHDEKAYDLEVEQRLSRQEEFLEQQADLYEAIEAKRADRSKGTEDLPTDFEDLPDKVGQVYDPNSIEITTGGMDSSAEPYLDSDSSDYKLPPIYPVDERERSLYVPPDDETLPSVDEVFHHNDVQTGEGVLPNADVVSESSAPTEDEDPTYLGQFYVTVVCTCGNCLDTQAYPDAKLCMSQLLCDPTYVAHGTKVRISADFIDDLLHTDLGTYTCQDAKGRVSGRNLILYTGTHNDDRPSSLYAKLYKIN